MNAIDPKLHADERRVTSPLFTDRRPSQCAWPLWPDFPAVPLHTKRCCGAPVLSGSKVPYCADHLTLQSGLGDEIGADGAEASPRHDSQQRRAVMERQHDHHCLLFIEGSVRRVLQVRMPRIVIACEAGCCRGVFNTTGIDFESYCAEAVLNDFANEARAARGSIPVEIWSGARN